MPLYIREYKELARERWGGPGVYIPAGKEKVGDVTQQTPVTVDGTSRQSAAFGNETSVILVTTSEACHITFGENPTATSNDHRMPADSTQFFGVDLGAKLKLAVIEST